MQVDSASTDVGQALNLKDRDPGHTNDFIKVSFEDIFAEPHPSTFSFDSVWKISFQVFTCTRLWCYRILTLVFAVPVACLWGVHFACLSCWAVWCCRPCIRSWQVVLSFYSSCYVILLESFIKPFFTAIGFIFHNFRVVVLQNQDKSPIEDMPFSLVLLRRFRENLSFEAMRKADKTKRNIKG